MPLVRTHTLLSLLLLLTTRVSGKIVLIAEKKKSTGSFVGVMYAVAATAVVFFFSPYIQPYIHAIHVYRAARYNRNKLGPRARVSVSCTFVNVRV